MTARLMAEAEELYRARDLLFQWTGRTLRARYQQSVLGWLWAVVQPVAQTAILAVIFTRLVPIETGDIPYLVFSYAATAPWAFLATSLTDMTNSLVENMNLVTKIYFRREALPVGTMLARLVDLGVALLLFIGLALYFDIPSFSPALIFLPAVVCVQILLVAGLGLACAAGNVFVRDVRPLLLLVLQLWFYASPVIYPLDFVPETVRRYYVLNPMVGIIEGYRSVLIRGEMPDATLVLAAVFSVAIFSAGYSLFRKAEFKFADIV